MLRVSEPRLGTLRQGKARALLGSGARSCCHCRSWYRLGATAADTLGTTTST